jgi:hypothetical protein
VTPRAWRLAAAVMLLGGMVGGFAAASDGRAMPLAVAEVLVVICFVVPIVVASRRPPIEAGAALRVPVGELPSVTVLVGARDEAGVIGRLVADVAAQDLRTADGAPRFELIVVDDRSSDGTGNAASAAGAAHGIADRVRVIRREGTDLPDGKGAALTAAPPDVCTGDVIVVLDADARLGPRLLRTIAGYVALGAPAVTARRRILDAGSSQLAGAQADEGLQDGLLERGRWAMGGCSEFRGNGISIRRDLLAAVGGWKASALTEDLDLSSRIAATHGVTVAWAVDAVVWEEPVRTWRALVRQRLRWAEGSLRRLFELGPSVVRSPRLSLRAKLDFLAYAAQLLSPGVIIGAVAGASVGGSGGAAAALVATYLAAAGVLAFDAQRWEPDAAGGIRAFAIRIARSVRGAAFSAIWLVAVPGALWRIAVRRGRVRYDKMTHHGSAVRDPAG